MSEFTWLCRVASRAGSFSFEILVLSWRRRSLRGSIWARMASPDVAMSSTIS
jgi:hypothetical protein